MHSSLFGWLPQTRPFHGPKKRWQDILKDDLSSLMVSDMTRLRTGFVGGIDGVKAPVTSWVINRQLDKCCAGFAEDLLEESMIRLATSASQKDIYLCRIKLVLYSAPPVSGGLEIKEDLLSTSVLLSIRRNQ